MWGAIGSMLRNTLGTQNTTHLPSPKRKKSSPHWLQELCVLCHFWVPIIVSSCDLHWLDEVPPKLFFFFFLGMSQFDRPIIPKKMKLWRLPKIEGSILKYRIPPLWPTYIYRWKRTTFAKVRCYWELFGEHVRNLGTLSFDTPF
jgi:hypothetical protein